MSIYVFALIILGMLAISDLVVGVSNDAVNFLNSSIGSKAAPKYIIMIIASLGMLAGVTFSSGMMEVARKGIFHPELFLMPDLIVLFLAVMLTDIILLDFFNTFGLPTSTTVSIVFELMGAAVAVSLIKISKAGESFSSLVNYINTGKALAIISGILLSIVIAFIIGATVQFITRFIFTFDFKVRLKRYGAIWGGVALSAIIYFILIKGAKGASFITDETLLWIKSNTWLILLIVFLFCWVIFQLITFFTKINILKVIVLTGTFALAMAFAANDLVNFIGVPLAGLSSYNVAVSGSGAISQTMEALKDPVRSNTLFLLIAGIVMVITLWFSKKSRTVTRTELSLGRQDEGVERFGSSHISRTIVRMITSFSEVFQKVIPTSWLEKTSKRIDQKYYKPVASKDGELTSFDLLRASVNLMVASTLIALGTSMKLPLSTTYVTFMVSMGTSFSDRAWGRESAVYRVNGVLTVIGGWFFTALMAFTVSCIFATAIFYWRVPAVLVILGLAIFLLLRSSRVHKNRMIEEQSMEIFNLKKITDVRSSIDISFEHTGIFIQEVKKYLEAGFDGLFKQNRLKLKAVRKDTKKIQRWANIIIANIFKILRLLQKEDIEDSQGYSYTVGSLQEIAESLRDITLRAYTHIDNNHKGLLKVQIEELEQIKECISNLLGKTSETLMKKEEIDCEFIEKKRKKLNGLVSKFNENQIERIQDDSSKTRLSILFYGLLWDSQRIAEHTLMLLKIFEETFKFGKKVKK